MVFLDPSYTVLLLECCLTWVCFLCFQLCILKGQILSKLSLKCSGIACLHITSHIVRSILHLLFGIIHSGWGRNSIL